MAQFQEQGLARPAAPQKAAAPAYQSLDLLDFIGKKDRPLSVEDLARKKLEEEAVRIQKAQVDLKAGLDAVAALAAQIQEERNAWWKKVQAEMAEAVAQLAAGVVNAEILTNPKVIANGVEALVAALSENEERAVTVNPADLELLQKENAAAFADLESKRVQFKADPALARGTVRLDRANYQMESSVLKALQVLMKEIAPNKNLNVNPAEEKTGA